MGVMDGFGPAQADLQRLTGVPVSDVVQAVATP